MARIEAVTVTVERFKTSDGGLFESRQDAVYHEKKIILGSFFAKSNDPYVKSLNQDQCQAVMKHLSLNLNSIIAELEISDLL